MAFLKTRLIHKPTLLTTLISGNFSHSFFTFIPAPEFMLKAHLSAKNQINEVTREREVNDILPLINHIIRYTGILYTPKESDDTFTLDILNGGKWDSPIDKDLKD